MKPSVLGEFLFSDSLTGGRSATNRGPIVVYVPKEVGEVLLINDDVQLVRSVMLVSNSF